MTRTCPVCGSTERGELIDAHDSEGIRFELHACATPGCNGAVGSLPNHPLMEELLDSVQAHAGHSPTHIRLRGGTAVETR